MKIGVLRTLFVLLGFSGPRNFSVDAKCEISLQHGLPMKEPLYLKRVGGHFEYIIPPENNAYSNKDASVFTLADHEELILSCPGKHNSLEHLSSTIIASHCFKDTRFLIGAKNTASIGQLKCSKNVKAVIRPNLHKSCARKGKEMFIGFEVAENRFLPLIRVCHDIRTSSTLYVEHEILATIRGAEVETGRPDFQIGPKPLYRGVDPNEVYSQEHQRKLFDELLGEGEGQRLIQGPYFLARSHLAPNADFLFGTWRWATFFYANAAPQWQIINMGYWKSLEMYIRKITAKMGEDIQIITGTHGILKLENTSGEKIAIFLQPKDKPQIKVPLLFFKIIHSQKTNAAIVAICANNPFEKVSFEGLCDDISAKNHWPPPDRFKDLPKGQIIFCDVNQFLSRTRADAPRVPYTSILQGLEP